MYIHALRLALVLIGGIILDSAIFFTPQEVPLGAVMDKTDDRLLVLEDVEFKGDKSTVVIRTSDSSVRQLPGTWNTFMDNSGVFVVGNSATSTEEFASSTMRVAYLSPNHGVIQMQLDGFTQPIIDMQNDRARKHTFVQLEVPGQTMICVSDSILTSSPTCTKVTFDSEGVATWDPERVGYLLVQLDHGGIFQYSVEQAKFNYINPEDPEDVVLHTRVSQLFTPYQSPKIYQLFGRTLINTHGSWKAVKLPRHTQLARIAPTSYLLRDGAKLSVFDVERQTIADLTTLTDVPDEHPIKLYSDNKEYYFENGNL